MLSYEGIFFDKKTEELIHSLEDPRLPIVNDEIHCTFKYHPDENEIFDEIVGREVEVELIGYGNDGNNSGFLIKLPNDIMPYYINKNAEGELVKPHITASLKEGAKASKTRDLNFKKLEEPIKIKGVFGYWIKEEISEYISFDKYKNSMTK